MCGSGREDREEEDKVEEILQEHQLLFKKMNDTCAISTELEGTDKRAIADDRFEILKFAPKFWQGSKTGSVNLNVYGQQAKLFSKPPKS